MQCFWYFLVTFVLLCSCERGNFLDNDSGLPGWALEEASIEALMQISQQDANDLINDGRTQIGQWGGQCKVWVQNTTSSSYGVWIPPNDTSPASDQHKWTNDYTPATNVARWLGSYANGRVGPVALNPGGSTVINVNVPNGDPQVVVVYATTSNVTATMTKGASTLSATSTSTMNGTISSSVVYGSGTWTFTVRNNGSTTAYDVVGVVLSRSRFVSDWETARRGDIMQMYVGTGSNRKFGGPHTTFVQTDYNVNSTCSGSNTSGCNWLDSNWVGYEIVGAHNVTMDTMMKMAAYSASYGFTVYRLN